MSTDTNLDRREGILSRMQTVLAALPNIAGAYRNRRGMKDAELPAIVILDADESTTSAVLVRKTIQVPPVMVKMSPQLFIGVKMRDDVTNSRLEGVIDPVGTELNHWRFAIHTAIVNDATLLDLVTVNGQIDYRGCESDLKTGSTIGAFGAQLRMAYDFHYPFFPPR